jgi:hypothetical protein
MNFAEAVDPKGGVQKSMPSHQANRACSHCGDYAQDRKSLATNLALERTGAESKLRARPNHRLQRTIGAGVIWCAPLAAEPEC